MITLSRENPSFSICLTTSSVNLSDGKTLNFGSTAVDGPAAAAPAAKLCDDVPAKKVQFFCEFWQF